MLETIAERKRRELTQSIKSGLVNEPLSATIFGVKLSTLLISALVSTAASVGTSLLTRALTPAQRIERGNMGGQELLMPRSQQGEFIPEIYGADPEFNATAWAATTAFTLGQRVKPPTYNGHYYRVTVAGTTGASQPTWPLVKGTTVVNGTVTFINAGRAGGGARVGPIIGWTSGIRKHTTTTQQGGKGGPKPAEVTNIEYDMDLMHIWARGPIEYYAMFANVDKMFDFRRTSTQTGVYDPDVDPDDTYDPDLPPGAVTHYTRPRERYNAMPLLDVEDALNFIVVRGGHHVIGAYAGNHLQTPDPYMEAAVDAEHGANSTPAYRGRGYSVHARVFLSKWLGAMPAFNAILGNRSYRTLTQIYGQFCDRTGLLTGSDYDFTELTNLDVRGFSISQKYAPAEPMEALARAYNCYFYEADKIYGKLRGGAVAANLVTSDMGWTEDDDGEGELPGLQTAIGSETDKPRRVDVKFTDPEKDLEQNSQGISRQIISSEKVDTLDLPLTLYPEEAREIAQRELYRRDIESIPHNFDLDWSYLWLNAGDSVQITEDDGFTHRVFIKSLRHNIGVIPVEGVSEDVTSFTQPVSTTGGSGFEQPPVPIPGMTVLGIYDGPVLRDNEYDVNNGAGLYAWATKRRGDGEWPGSGLYFDKGLGYELIETFELEATMGIAATALTGTTTLGVIVADTVTVDLYEDEHTLESHADADLWLGAGAAIIGKEVVNIKTATREPDTVTWPNRWYLTIGLRGRRMTEGEIGTHVIGEKFLLINNAVKFIPLPTDQLNVARNWKMVTSGQSLDDAAVVPFTWTGKSGQTSPPTSLTGIYDVDGTLLIEWIGTPLPNTPELEKYDVEIWNSANTVKLATRGPVPPTAEVSEFIKWVETSDPGSLATVQADGSVNLIQGFFETTLESSNASSPEGGLYFEYTMSLTEKLPRFVSIFPTNTTGIDGGVEGALGWWRSQTGATWWYQPETTDAGSIAYRIFPSPGDRVGIWIRPDGAVEYHLNRVGPESKPVQVSGKRKAPGQVYKAFIRENSDSFNSSQLKNARWIRAGNEFKYTPAMQLADFGAPLPDPIRIKIRQHARFLGGPKSEPVMGSFAR